MSRLDDHYRILGIDADATNDVVESAVERLVEQADVLAYTSPQRANELWDRVRQIRQDLLSDPERRALYNQALLQTRTVPIAPSVPSPAAAAPAVALSTRDRRRRAAPFLPLLVSAIMGAAVVLAAMTALEHRTATVKPSVPTAMMLSVAGSRHAGQYPSGQPVAFRWSRIPHAIKYQLRIVAMTGDPRAPFQTVVTTNTSYTTSLLGLQRYMWRVRPYVTGRWGRASRWQSLTVSRPAVGVPVPLTPANQAVIAATQVQFCWTRVEGASGYRLRIRGVGGRSLHDTCAWMSVHPAPYRWTVAALVRGRYVYTGAFTRRQYFTVVSTVALLSASPHSKGAHSAIKHREFKHTLRPKQKTVPMIAASRARPSTSDSYRGQPVVALAAAVLPASHALTLHAGGGESTVAGYPRQRRPAARVRRASSPGRLAAPSSPQPLASVFRLVLPAGAHARVHQSHRRHRRRTTGSVHVQPVIVPQTVQPPPLPAVPATALPASLPEVGIAAVPNGQPVSGGPTTIDPRSAVGRSTDAVSGAGQRAAGDIVYRPPGGPASANPPAQNPLPAAGVWRKYTTAFVARV